MRDIASDLGLSDVGLHKLCKRNGILTPPQSYHLMSSEVEKGRLQKPLPEPEGAQQRVFYFRVPDKTMQEAQGAARLAAQSKVDQAFRHLTPKDEKDIERAFAQCRGKLDLRKLDDR